MSFNLEPEIVIFKKDPEHYLEDEFRTLTLPALFGMKLMIKTRRPSKSAAAIDTVDDLLYCNGHRKRSELSRIIRYEEILVRPR